MRVLICGSPTKKNKPHKKNIINCALTHDDNATQLQHQRNDVNDATRPATVVERGAHFACQWHR